MVQEHRLPVHRMKKLLIALLLILIGFASGMLIYRNLTTDVYDYAVEGVYETTAPLLLPDAFDAETMMQVFDESNPTRAAGLYIMYTLHNQHPYSEEWHCGDMAEEGLRRVLEMGLTARMGTISGGTHAFFEVQIDGQWELFDPTTNVWIDHSAVELMAGLSRTYRAFYTPVLDENRPDFRNRFTHDLLSLRLLMPRLGLTWQPKAVIEYADSV
jgi:hypothetical protein